MRRQNPLSREPSPFARHREATLQSRRC